MLINIKLAKEGRMRVLAIGDVTAKVGRDFLCQYINEIIKENNIDFCIVNAENASNSNGVAEEDVIEILKNKINVITLGNHAFSNRGVYSAFKNFDNLLRPVNYPEGTPGRFFTIRRIGDVEIAVISALGRVFMNNQIDCPFRAVDKLLTKIRKYVDIIVIDFHAEATSEKIAFANYFDGRVDIIFGTHTHVQTADERILPNGTAYITDVGMTGVEDSILGVKKQIIIQSLLTGRHHRHEKATGSVVICGAIFEVDIYLKKIWKIERLKFSI